jgi:hypothetical protein
MEISTDEKKKNLTTSKCPFMIKENKKEGKDQLEMNQHGS